MFQRDETSKYIQLKPPSQNLQSIQQRSNGESFENKRKYVYRIFVELYKLVGNQSLQQEKYDSKGKGTLFTDVDQFFQKLLSSTFQVHVVSATISLSDKIKHQTKITAQDKDEFIEGLKIQETQMNNNSFISKKKKKKEKKLFLLSNQQMYQDQIKDCIKIIIKNLIEIFCKD